MVGWAGKRAVFLFDLGDCKIAACAALAAAQASFLSRLNPQATLYAAVAGRVRRADLVQCLQTEPRSLLEQAVCLGARERVATRLIAARVPAAAVDARRRQARRDAQKRGSTPSQAPLTL